MASDEAISHSVFADQFRRNVDVDRATFHPSTPGLLTRLRASSTRGPQVCAAASSVSGPSRTSSGPERPAEESGIHCGSHVARQMRSLGWLSTLVVTGGLMSCASAAMGPRASNAPLGDKNCFRPLAAYCGTEPCQSYSQSVNWVQQCLTRHCLSVSWGTCDDFTFTSHGDGFGGETLYFNRDGALVAVTVSTDYLGRSRCPGWVHYGARMTCEEVTLQKIDRTKR